MSIPFLEPYEVLLPTQTKTRSEITIAETPSTINMHVQPYSTGDTRADQEVFSELGIKSARGLLRVTSDSELKALDKSAGTLGHRFMWQGRKYEIMSVRYWNAPGFEDLAHYRGIAMVLEEKTVNAEPPEEE